MYSTSQQYIRIARRSALRIPALWNASIIPQTIHLALQHIFNGVLQINW